VLVTGTLGLAYPACAAAIRKAVEAAKAGGCKARCILGMRRGGAVPGGCVVF
jgi:hypothetical protein